MFPYPSEKNPQLSLSASCLACFSRKVDYYYYIVSSNNLRVGLIIVLLRPKPPRDHLIFDGERQRVVVVAAGRHIPVLHQLVVQVSINRLFHAAHRRLLGNFGNADSPPSDRRSLSHRRLGPIANGHDIGAAAMILRANCSCSCEPVTGVNRKSIILFHLVKLRQPWQRCDHDVILTLV